MTPPLIILPLLTGCAPARTPSCTSSLTFSPFSSLLLSPIYFCSCLVSSPSSLSPKLSSPFASVFYILFPASFPSIVLSSLFFLFISSCFLVLFPLLHPRLFTFLHPSPPFLYLLLLLPLLSSPPRPHQRNKRRSTTPLLFRQLNAPPLAPPPSVYMIIVVMVTVMLFIICSSSLQVGRREETPAAPLSFQTGRRRAAKRPAFWWEAGRCWLASGGAADLEKEAETQSVIPLHRLY